MRFDKLSFFWGLFVGDKHKKKTDQVFKIYKEDRMHCIKNINYVSRNLKKKKELTDRK